ncbi:MAG: GNAT family N-acetyltransferase [Armatimonadota bacterium]
MIIREMTADDLDLVRHLDAVAFIPYMKKTGKEDSFQIRSRESVLACLALNPSGCFVAEDEDIVGYIFSRCCGDIGWIGTFGVHPDKQCRGIGHLLLKASSDNLEHAGCKVIGLETMPDSPYNVGMYTKAGFRSGYPTLHLAHKVQNTCSTQNIAVQHQASKESNILALSSICSTAFPGLDYTNMAQNAVEFGWGETIFIGSQEPWAAAIMKPHGTFVVATVIALPCGRNAIGEIIQTMDAWGFDRGISDLFLSINTIDWQSAQWLLGNDFNVQFVTLRMLLKGEYPRPDGLDMSGWAM